MTLMMIGYSMGYSSDVTLLKLKRQNTGYQLPHGNMFEYVSAPHFLGEILEWTGFAIAANTMAAYSFPIWSAANLIPRAILQHQWYRSTFREYPRNRKAIFPFLW
jgi:3-oxo-5-alpha-steroid 4-dehydrogenase 1